jgi:hypothetical protein
MPDLVGLKRKAELMVDGPCEEHGDPDASRNRREPKLCAMIGSFLARLPLTITKTKLAEALGGDIKVIDSVN